MNKVPISTTNGLELFIKINSGKKKQHENTKFIFSCLYNSHMCLRKNQRHL